MDGTTMRRVIISSVLLSTVLLSGCILAPRETKDEKARLDKASVPFETPVEERDLPQLTDSPTWQDVLHRAFLANGDLEAAYFEWKAAIQRIDIAAAWPNSNVQLGFEYMFSPGRMKSWDRTTVTAGFDPAMSLSQPVKIAKAGQAALESARAAGYRFETTKFDIQKRVLNAYSGPGADRGNDSHSARQCGTAQDRLTVGRESRAGGRTAAGPA